MTPCTLFETDQKDAKNDSKKKSPADDLICLITLELPWDPVMAEDGRVYERNAIEEHFNQHQGALKSPITNKEMGQRLVRAPQIKSLIETLIENGGLDGELAVTWTARDKK
jgi:hypothetical protein